MPPERVERKLAAILAADVAGYSRLMGADEAGTARVLREHRATIDPIVASYDGRIVKTTGDGLLLEFPSIVAAVECAVAVQKLMAERNAEVPQDRRMLFRIGINLGDVLVEDDDILGDGVNIAARLEGIADPGGICISESSYQQVRDKLAIGFEDMGEQQLKNIARPVRAYRVPLDASPAKETPALGLAAVLAAGGETIDSVAVLPFVNTSDDPNTEYLSDGIAETLISSLTQLRGLRVMARGTVFRFKGQDVDPQKIGRDLQVRAVVTGRLMQRGDTLTFQTELVDVAKGSRLWGAHYDRKVADVLGVQEEIAHEISQNLRLRLTGEDQKRLARSATSNSEAYQDYLKGRYWWNKATEEGFDKGIEFFRRAIAKDPTYAQAYSDLRPGLFRLGRLLQLACR